MVQQALIHHALRLPPMLASFDRKQQRHKWKLMAPSLHWTYSQGESSSSACTSHKPTDYNPEPWSGPAFRWRPEARRARHCLVATASGSTASNPSSTHINSVQISPPTGWEKVTTKRSHHSSRTSPSRPRQVTAAATCCLAPLIEAAGLIQWIWWQRRSSAAPGGLGLTLQTLTGCLAPAFCFCRCCTESFSGEILELWRERQVAHLSSDGAFFHVLNQPWGSAQIKSALLSFGFNRLLC